MFPPPKKSLVSRVSKKSSTVGSKQPSVKTQSVTRNSTKSLASKPSKMSAPGELFLIPTMTNKNGILLTPSYVGLCGEKFKVRSYLVCSLEIAVNMTPRVENLARPNKNVHQSRDQPGPLISGQSEPRCQGELTRPTCRDVVDRTASQKLFPSYLDRPRRHPWGKLQKAAFPVFCEPSFLSRFGPISLRRDSAHGNSRIQPGRRQTKNLGSRRLWSSFPVHSGFGSSVRLDSYMAPVDKEIVVRRDDGPDRVILSYRHTYVLLSISCPKKTCRRKDSMLSCTLIYCEKLCRDVSM